MSKQLDIIWKDSDKAGYMALFDGDEQLSQEYKVTQEDFYKIAYMVKDIVNVGYEQGKKDKAAEIREALYIDENA
jgi:hypothetical protein